MTQPDSQTVRLAWHHLILQTPPHWEVIGYKLDPQAGRLVVADARGETLQAHWQVVKRRPLVGRTLREFVATVPGIGLNEAEIRSRVTNVAGWDAFLPTRRGLPVFAARFYEPAKVLLHFAFPPHPDTAAREEIRRVLESWQPNDGPDKAWAAFGLDFNLPNSMKLANVTALPASQVMEFENKRGETAAIHRYGMMPLILGDGDMATFFARVKGKKFQLRRIGEYVKDGRYEGVQLEYSTRGKGGMDSLLARLWQGRVWVWRCDDLKRLYAADNNALAKNLIPDLPERVNCRVH